jgi:serine/threonine protein phosphatase PrpC
MTDIRTSTYSQAGRRAENQDCATVAENDGQVLFVVADGMGGLEAGARAAETAVESLNRWFRCGPLFSHQEFTEAFQAANRAVYKMGVDSGRIGKVGTTLVACLTDGSRYLVAHAGDSRCYYINAHEARCLTRDHSRVQELVTSGAMTAAAARVSPFRHELTNALGEPKRIVVDVTPAAPHFGVVDEPCILLACSDGLHAWVENADILNVLRTAPGPDVGVKRLAEVALRNGSTDNITLAAIEVGAFPRDQARRRSWWRRPSREEIWRTG